MVEIMLVTPDVLFFYAATTTGFYTLSLHDALPISGEAQRVRERARLAERHREAGVERVARGRGSGAHVPPRPRDRKSTRLNSSHANISYAVFCLKKKIVRLHRRHHAQAHSVGPHTD